MRPFVLDGRTSFFHNLSSVLTQKFHEQFDVPMSSFLRKGIQIVLNFLDSGSR